MGDDGTRHIRAHGGMGSVEGRACGAIHPCGGPFTPRLEVPAFLALSERIIQVRQELTRVARAHGEASASPRTRAAEGVRSLGRRELLQASLGLPLLLGAPRAGAQVPPAERWVSLGGPISETLVALGLRSRMVGVDSSSVWPAELRELPQVGYYRQLGAEGILSLRPTRVLTTEEAGPAEALEQIERAGVPVERFASPRDPREAEARVRAIGRATGAPEAAEILALQLRTGFAEAALLSSGRAPLAVLFLLSRGAGAAMAAGQDTAADAMIGLIGGRNAVQGFTGYRPLSPESAVAAAPALVLVTHGGLEALGGEDALWALPGLSLTPAGRGRRLLVEDDLALLGFGPRSGRTAAALARALRGFAP